MLGVVALLAAVALTLLIGWWHRRAQGRVSTAFADADGPGADSSGAAPSTASTAAVRTDRTRSKVRSAGGSNPGAAAAQFDGATVAGSGKSEVDGEAAVDGEADIDATADQASGPAAGNALGVRGAAAVGSTAGNGSEITDRTAADRWPQAVREALAKAADNTSASTAAPEPRVTLLQLSTTFCTPCRHTRLVLTGLVADVPELRHVEMDVTDLPEVVRALHVFRVPTTIALDSEARELFRVGGVPRRDTLLAAVLPHLSAHVSED